VDVDSIRQTLISEARMEEERQEEERELEEETRSVINAVRNNSSLTFGEKLRLAGEQGRKVLSHKFKDEDTEPELFYEDNYYSILSRTFSIMNHALAKIAAEKHKPDVLVKMPFDAYGEIADYAKAEEISQRGRELMKAALDKYEQSLPLGINEI
jgi:hypothetical protein